MIIEIRAAAPLQALCNKPEEAIIDFLSSAVKTNQLTSEFPTAPFSQIPRILQLSRRNKVHCSSRLTSGDALIDNCSAGPH